MKVGVLTLVPRRVREACIAPDLSIGIGLEHTLHLCTNMRLEHTLVHRLVTLSYTSWLIPLTLTAVAETG